MLYTGDAERTIRKKDCAIRLFGIFLAIVLWSYLGWNIAHKTDGAPADWLALSVPDYIAACGVTISQFYTGLLIWLLVVGGLAFTRRYVAVAIFALLTVGSATFNSLTFNVILN